MSKELVNQLSQTPIHSEKGSGLAIYNVNRRLTMMFGEAAALKIASEPDKGTDISFSIPYKVEEKTNEINHKDINC